ncbi:hypothetical protein UW163_20165 (plasmid) [Ralstonia solanacearum]|nr:hypothetical protein UW163_20165 [Ralstonia solanacearum]EUJ12274.1 hypothetical protein RSP673_22305 [Ralstonia solanacearum P673]OAI66784.1 hypothetical protein RSP797_23230 [Ralstonia solanacearum]
MRHALATPHDDDLLRPMLGAHTGSTSTVRPFAIGFASGRDAASRPTSRQRTRGARTCRTCRTCDRAQATSAKHPHMSSALRPTDFAGDHGASRHLRSPFLLTR